MTASARHRLALVAAFAAVYLIWGSTYLVIKYAIESIEPFFMAGVRFILAGGAMLAWLALRGRLGHGALAPRSLLLAAVVGVLMLGIGNGVVVWCIEHGAPTGLVAVLVATTPFWLVLLDRFVERRRRVGVRPLIGLAVGFAGIIVLSTPGGSGDPLGVAGKAESGPSGLMLLGATLLATLAWSCGSTLVRAAGQRAKARNAADPASAVDPFVAPALQMIAGGAWLLAWSLLANAEGVPDLGAVTLRSALAFAYLVLFGSIIGYTAFVWLLRHVSAAAVGTYAYVNPVVAVILGWLFAGEALTPRTLVATVLILGAVVLITTAPTGRREREAAEEAEAAGAGAAATDAGAAPALRR